MLMEDGGRAVKVGLRGEGGMTRHEKEDGNSREDAHAMKKPTR